jgi:hypothetical protein
MLLNKQDRALVLAAIAYIKRAIQRNDTWIKLDTPEGFSAGDKAFQSVVLQELRRSGKIERKYAQ